MDGEHPHTPQDAIREAEEWLFDARATWEPLGGGGEATSEVQAAERYLEETRRRYGEPEPEPDPAPETDFAELILRTFREGIHEEVDRLTFDEMMGVAVAISWLRARSRSELATDNVRQAGLVEEARFVAPSLDDLMWEMPDLSEVDEVVRGQWSTARWVWQKVAEDRAFDALEVPPRLSTRDRLDLLLRQFLP